MRRARRVVPLVVAQQPAEAANIVVPGKVAVEEALALPAFDAGVAFWNRRQQLGVLLPIYLGQGGISQEKLIMRDFRVEEFDQAVTLAIAQSLRPLD